MPVFLHMVLVLPAPSIYMLRAYQSPYSADDCGPQCAHSPSFASRNHSGIRYACRDSGAAVNGPAAISGFRSGAWICARVVIADPSSAIADRLVIIRYPLSIFRRPLFRFEFVKSVLVVASSGSSARLCFVDEGLDGIAVRGGIGKLFGCPKAP